MPLFEFSCASCGHVFEEIVKTEDASPACPACGSQDARRQISMPSPLKTGAFPYKPGPVHPLGKGGQFKPSGCGGACPK